MKKVFTLLSLVLTLLSVGCIGKFSTPSAPVPVSTATPTPSLVAVLTATPTSSMVPVLTATPVPSLAPGCGMTPVIMPLALLPLADSGIHVIQNMVQWDQFCQPGGNLVYFTPVPTPTPPPAPVNFANQMIISAGDPQPCDLTTTTITDVCVGPSQVTVYVTSQTCNTCLQCNLASSYTNLSSMVAVPQSNLPVSVVYTYVRY